MMAWAEVFVVEHAAPRLERLVGGEDHGPMAAMPLVDDVKEHVGRVGAVREIADFVDDEDRWVRVGRQGLPRAAGAKRGGEIVDQRRRGREERIEAVLNRAVRDGDGQMRFAAPGFAAEKISERPSVTKSGDERRAEHVQPQRSIDR